MLTESAPRSTSAAGDRSLQCWWGWAWRSGRGECARAVVTAKPRGDDGEARRSHSTIPTIVFVVGGVALALGLLLVLVWEVMLWRERRNERDN